MLMLLLRGRRIPARCRTAGGRRRVASGTRHGTRRRGTLYPRRLRHRRLHCPVVDDGRIVDVALHRPQ